MTAVKTYFPNLDALRFLAALAVICGHMVNWFQWPQGQISKWIQIALTLDGTGGKAGVSFFFTLSGFLITWLMYEEMSRTSTLSVRKFYTRRIFRIWPLYFVTLFIGFVLYPYITTVQGFKETADWRMYVFFLNNFEFVYKGIPENGLLHVQWSIAVEEQFYFIWPWIFLLFSSARFFPWACAALIAGSFLFHVSGGDYYHSLTALNDLAIGALLAYWAFNHLESITRFFQKQTKTGTVLIYLIGFILLVSNYQLGSRLMYFKWFDGIIYSVFFGYIIMEQNYSPHSFVKFGSFGIFSWLGKISYGLYLLHMEAIYIVLFLNSAWRMPLFANIILTLIVTIGLSFLSYRFLESPFLKLKEKFSI